MNAQRGGSGFVDWRMRSRLTPERDETIYILTSIVLMILASAVLTLF